jgi:hypothetical protein
MTTLRGDDIVKDFKKILDNYVQARYGSASSQEEQLIEVR